MSFGEQFCWKAQRFFLRAESNSLTKNCFSAKQFGGYYAKSIFSLFFRDEMLHFLIVYRGHVPSMQIFIKTITCPAITPSLTLATNARRS